MARLGVPATGQDFFGNEAALTATEKAIQRGDPCLIVAPRRAGKTSLMRAVQARLPPRQREDSRFLDLSYIESPWELVRALSPERDGEGLILAQVQDADPRRPLQGIVERLGPDQLILFLDEIDRPFRSPKANEWGDILRILAEARGVCLVVSMDSATDSPLRDRIHGFLGSRTKTIRLTPWPIEVVRLFLKASLDAEDGKVIPKLIEHVAMVLEPAWPFEAIQAVFELEESKRKTKSLSSEVTDESLDRAAEAVGGGATFADFLSKAMSRATIRAATFLLEQLALAGSEIQLDEAADKGRFRLHDLDAAARRLSEFGILDLDMKARSVRPATGLMRRKLVQDFAHDDAAS